jgi:hypothetical protein
MYIHYSLVCVHIYEPLLFVYSIVNPLKSSWVCHVNYYCRRLQDCTAVVVYITVLYVHLCIYLYYSCIHQHTRLYAHTSRNSPKFGDVS